MNNTQHVNTPSRNNNVNLFDKAEENNDANSSEHIHVSSFSAVEEVKVDEAEENNDANRSEDIHASSFSAVEEVKVDEAEEKRHTSVHSRHSYVSTLNPVQEVDVPRQEQEEINRVPATLLPSHQLLSFEAKKGEFTTPFLNMSLSGHCLSYPTEDVG
ncbi:MAG: hypothetical protein ACRC2N_06980 [Aeromonas sp.]